MSADRDRAWTAIRQAPQAGLAAIGQRSDPWSAWARGVILMATGDFGTSFRLLTPLTGRGETEVAGLAAARLASGLRQLDEHASAVAWDELAMAAQGQAVIDGLIGRAADAVGAGDIELAARYLSSAQDRVGQVRDEIRVAWVATEISLLKGHHLVAAAHAERAHKLALAMGSPRHVVKSTLFWGAAAMTLDREVAVDRLRRGYDRARSLALRPLLWPMVAVLGEAATGEQRMTAAAAIGYIADHLPPGHGRGWVSRADIAALRRVA